MSKTYEKADAEVTGVLGDMMRRYHEPLVTAGVTIDVLMVSDIDEETNENRPALKLHGYGAAATIKVVSLKDRALGRADALLTIDQCTWDRCTAAEARALLDHELEHLEFVVDDVGEPKLDDLKRPRLRCRLHDWNLQGFDAIAKRHGPHALEVQAIRACAGENGQMRWEFDIEEAVEMVAASDGRAARAS